MEISPVKQISDFLEKFTLGICVILCVVMVVISWSHVFWRYALNNALTWSEECLRFMLVSLGMFSASVIQRHRAHIGVEFFRQHMPKRMQYVVGRAVTYIEICVTAVATVGGFILLVKSQGQITPALGIPYSLVYASIPISFLLMTFYGIEHAVQEIQGSRHK